MATDSTARSESALQEAPANCPYCDRRTTGPFRSAHMREHVGFCETRWQPIATAPDGQRLRLGNEGDVSSMKVDTICPTFGTREDGRWKLNSFFLLPMPRGAFSTAYASSEPTHWLPRMPNAPRETAVLPKDHPND